MTHPIDPPVVELDTGRVPARFHRFLTVPALLVAIAALLGHRYFLMSLIVFPPVIAMPWLVAAAARPTARAVDRAHTAVRSAGHVMCAVGVLAVLWALPSLDAVSDFALGAIIIGIAALVLAAVGFEPREDRLGLSLAVIGLAQIGAMIILVWVAPHAITLLPTGALMIVGGLAWFGESSATPSAEPTLPSAVLVHRA